MSHSVTPSPYPGHGEVIDGKYQIDKVLGEGGMGMVARAYHLLLHSRVALKFMNPQFMTFPGAVERFLQEGRASKKIRSDHVVPVEDVGKLPSGAPYLVMPCLEGVDLADLLARDGTPGLPTQRAIHFTLQILRGLQAAHAAGIVHRDMKPSNCFVVTHDGEADFIRILDFGISKVQQPGQSASLTQTNSALGTPLYMSPEQARSPRDVDGRSDIYSVGVILYELLTGHTPFFSESGEFTEILFKLFTADPPPVKSTRPDLDDALAEVVHKALARETNDRYATAQEMAVALEPWAGEASKHLISRIKAFKAAEAVSIAPPADMALPASMVAFSQLDAKHQTEAMPHRPTTDVMRGPPVTAILENAPGRVPASPARTPQPTGESASRMSAAPVAVDHRARLEDATARTQFDVSQGSPPAAAVMTGAQTGGDVVVARAAITGASTDLGATRDATPSVSGEQKRSPLIYALPVVALLAGAGIVMALASKKETPVKAVDPPPQASTVTSSAVTPPPPSASTAVTTSNAAPSASVAASATSSASATAPTQVAKPPPRPPVGRPNGGSTSGSVLDTPIHQ
ncbi:MAG: protein kinase [Deltaproteobacteria bacterium]|nr:protein kinase [Deltaproteobacteria bacterium]